VTGKTIRPRNIARNDVEAAVDYYADEGGVDTAIRFVAAVESAYAHIAAYPDAGSPRYGLALNLVGLRTWPVAPFPYMIFYISQETHIDVWRVLHGHRDIPASLQSDESHDR
jgi:toxin ParE1/3/4